MLHLLDVRDRALFGCVERDDDGTHNADGATNLANEGQALFEEDSAQYGGDDDGQCAQWGDQYGVGEGVGDEVAELAQDHERHAAPPPGVLEVAIAFSCFFVVLDVGLQEADLLQHE